VTHTSPISPPSPAPLPAAASDSRRREFEGLLAEVLQPAYGLAFNLTRNRDDADDLLQDAALQAFRAFHTFRRGTNFRAWFYRVLTNLHYYRHRKSRREVETTAWEDATDLYLYARATEADLHARSEDPAALVLGRLTTEQVTAAIAALPEEFRVVCTLNLVDDLAYHEIAEILGCPVGTVRSRLHRGRKLLQRALWHVVQESGGLKSLSSGA
jgi:RNA polymerase sigma-70 factor (ECF subfamily)